MNPYLNEVVGDDWLWRYARFPEEALTYAFAGVILGSGRGDIRPPNLGMGLAREHFAALLARYFPGAELTPAAVDHLASCVAGNVRRVDEFDELLALLLEHRSDDAPYTTWLAYALASGCTGGKHLFEDMGLPERQMLSDLLERHFAALYRKNTGNMRWKKFFYKQLCDRAEVKACLAPSCGVCSEYHDCFGPEEASPVGARMSDSCTV